MEWLRIFVSRLVGIFRKQDLDGELDTELRAHIDALIEENVRRRNEPGRSTLRSAA